MLFKKINKKGEGIGNIIFFVFILFLIMIIGMGVAFGGIAVDWVADTAIPEISGIGMVGSANMTQISSSVGTPINNITNSFSWLFGVIYIMALLGTIGLSLGFRITGNKWLMAFFVGCMFILLIASIFISNIYETFYNDTGEVAARLHEYILLSFMVLYSPIVITIIGFIGGIIMFSGMNSEEEI